MAIVVLVLWLFTAGAGLYLLVTGDLGHVRPAADAAMAGQVRDRFAPPSLTASRNAPMVPGLRSVLEFAHPACALVGFGFWMGYTLVHYRALGWIGFGLVMVTAALGASWFAANARAARRRAGTEHRPADGRGAGTEHRPADRRPSFSGRLVAVHGGAAAVTTVLAALTVLVLRR